MRLIDAQALHNKIVGLENLAMETLKVQDETAEFQRWQTILGERTAFKHDVFDAPTIDAVPVVRCRECAVPHNRWTGCPKLGGLIPPDDFYCAFGERKDGAE